MGASHTLAEPATGSVEVPGTADMATGSSSIRRSTHASAGLVSRPYPDVGTLYEAFQRGVREAGGSNCLGTRVLITPGSKDVKAVYGDYVWKTYNEVHTEILQLGSAMVNLNLAPESTDTPAMRLIGLFSKNREEWVVAEQACNAYNFVTVPLYDTLGTEAIVFIVAQSQLATVFCAKADTAALLKAKAGSGVQLGCLRTVVQFDDVTESDRKSAADAGVTLRAYAELLELGKSHPVPVRPPTPADVHTFCYTSGTTGEPKGAMLTHQNAVSMIAGALMAGVTITHADVHLSYLPLAHVFERLVEGVCWTQGAAVGFYQGNTLAIMEDLVALRPTIFPSVPRLLNRIYDKVVSGAAKEGGLKSAVFTQAFESKKYWLKRNFVHHKLWDTLVFSKLKAKVGLDRCHLIVTGSAPIADHVLEFLRVAFGCTVCEGYGQTECYGASCITNVRDHASLGHVGGPIACNEIKLVAVPEMAYNVTDKYHGRVVEADGTVSSEGLACLGRGEICYRGYNVFAGYYRNPEKTAEAIDADGWLHSGDIGLFTTQGNLKIIDRKKNIFKLSQGEYIAVEKVENAYLKCPFVSQIFVYGDSLQSCLVAVVVPDPEHVRVWAAGAGVDPASPLAHVCALPAFVAAVQTAMNASAKEGQLKGFEMARAIRVVPEAFSVENDLLTPTFKLKRNVAQRRYQGLIDDMYAHPDIGAVAGLVGLKQGGSAAAARVAAGGGGGKD